MARPNEDNGYLQSEATPAALKQMDESYCIREAGPARHHPPHLFYKLSPVNWLILWGQPGDEADQLEELGVRGRIWALALLVVRLTPMVRTAKAIAKAAMPPAGSNSPLVREIKILLKVADKKDAKVTDYLQSLISANRRDKFPPSATAKLFTELMLQFAIHRLLSDVGDAETAEAEFRAAFNSKARLPSEIFRRLSDVVRKFVDEAKLEQLRSPIGSEGRSPGDDGLGREWKAELSQVDAAIDHKLVDRASAMMEPDDEDENDPTVRKILHELNGTARLIIVSGEPLLGKKTRVKGVLRIMAKEDRRLIFSLRAFSGKLIDYLPVMVVSAGAQGYRQLIDKVTRFLEKYEQEALSQGWKQRKGQSGGRLTAHFDEAVEDIFAQYRSRPALFVITDVEAFEFDRTRQAIRDTGIRRLIEALLAGNRHSRVLITTTDEITESQANGYLARPRKTELVKVAAPNTADLKLFVVEQSYVRLPPELSDNPTEIRGDDLVALAALAALAYDPSGPDRTLDEAEFGDVIAFLAKPRGERDAERRKLYRALIKRIACWDVLHALALVAASHDGLRDDSMRRLLSLWSDLDPDAAAQDDLNERLARFRAVAGDRFLRRSRLPRYDRDEYLPDEQHSENDQVWDMDPNVAYWFLKILDQTHPRIVSASHRLIARIARERAQNKKLRMRSPLGSRVTEDAPRDVQAYTSLLASIRLDAGAQYSIEGPPLRNCEDDMFSIDPARFNPARALRFAAYSLLREDIDHDHRLSMVFDEDALRLDLYLLLLLPPGRQHPTKLERLRAPTALPDHLLNGIFRPGEVLDLMSTAALSAYHSQRFEPLEHIVQLAEQFAAVHAKSEDVAAKLSRLWCSQIDAYILCGGPPQGGGHRATLTLLSNLRERLFPSVGHDVDALFALKPSLARFKAYMRLLAREGELNGLIDPAGIEARARYDLLDALEAKFSTNVGQHDPIVVNGRVARRYLRYLLSDGGIARQRADGMTEEQTLSRVRGLLSVNTSRLRRFSGAERVGVMVDHARVALFETEFAMGRGDLGGALRHLTSAKVYADTANRRAFSSSASHATKFDVLAIHSEANCKYAEFEFEGLLGSIDHPGEAIELAGIAAHDLGKMAEGLGARPTLGLALYLEGTALTLEARMQRAERRYGGRHHPKPLEEAQRKLRAARKVMTEIHDRSLDGRIERALKLLTIDIPASQAIR